MVLSSSNIIAVAELAGYLPAIIVAAIVCARHGFSRSSGQDISLLTQLLHKLTMASRIFRWYYTFSLCLVRVVGAACQLWTLTNNSVKLLEAVLVLQHIGLTPLLLASLGMLSRLVDIINSRTLHSSTGIKTFRLAQLFAVFGAVFGIIGAESSASSPGSVWTHVGVICYLGTFFVVAFILVASLSSLNSVEGRERLLAPAVGLALPFVFVRLLYQILLVFIHSGAFVRTDGPILVLVFMSLVEEFVVVSIYLCLGLTLGKLSESEQGPILSRPWKNRDKRSRRRRRRGDPGSRQFLAEEYSMR